MLMPSLFDEFFDDFARPAKSVVRYNYPATEVMKTDVKEDENGYDLDIELPGYKKDDVKAELKEGYLTITASKTEKQENHDKKGRYIRRERYYGTSSRSFYVGEEVTEEDIKAKFEDGILKIYVPKKEPVHEIPQSKYIAIEG